MIPLPWLIAGWLASTLLASLGAYLHGVETTQDAMLAASAQASDKAIRRFNAYTAEDIEAARLAAERAGRQRLAAQQIRNKFELEAARGAILQTVPDPAAPAGTPPPSVGPVRLSDAGISLFNAAIDAYNAHAQPAGSRRDPVPPDAAPRPADPGGGAGAPRTAGRDLRISYYLRTDAPRGGGVAAAAD